MPTGGVSFQEEGVSAEGVCLLEGSLSRGDVSVQERGAWMETLSAATASVGTHPTGMHSYCFLPLHPSF